jgi:hypothetical protein
MQNKPELKISDADFVRYLTPEGRLDVDRLVNDRRETLRARPRELGPQYRHSSKRDLQYQRPSPA